ncbi:MAG TPA: hypothetical protein VD815_03400 [Candidatus Saccharimonadales bacterium]|nr:hypothetical protein [Candidatus Saccharimonadales bacterium]
MNIKICSLLVLAITLATPISFLYLLEIAYSQQPQQEINSPLTSVDIQNTNLTLGKPIYVEKFEVPISSDNDDYANNHDIADSNNSVYSFKGNGTLKDLEISATGSGIVVPRDDDTSSITGRAIFISQNGSASYSFEDIANTEGNITQRLGSAFFDANATGNLEFLKSSVGVYESYVDNSDGQGIFAMWNLKGFLTE